MGVLSPPYLVIDKFECSVNIYRGPWINYRLEESDTFTYDNIFLVVCNVGSEFKSISCAFIIIDLTLSFYLNMCKHYTYYVNSSGRIFEIHFTRYNNRKNIFLLSFKETKKGQRKIFNQSPRSNLDYPSLYAVLSGEDNAQCCVLSGHCFF